MTNIYNTTNIEYNRKDDFILKLNPCSPTISHIKRLKVQKGIMVFPVNGYLNYENNSCIKILPIPRELKKRCDAFVQTSSEALMPPPVNILNINRLHALKKD